MGELIRLTHDETNSRVWNHVEEALRAIGPGLPEINLKEQKSNVPELLELLKSPDVYVRLYGTFALGYYKPLSDQKVIVEALISATKDQDGVVRWMAVGALGRLGPIARDAVPVLIQILRTGDQPMRVQSTIALSKIGPDAAEAAPVLLDQLYNGNYQLHIFAAIALARIGPTILPLMEREIKTHPFHVLEVLEHLGPSGASLVIEALRMKNKEVQKKAIEVIKWHGTAAAPAIPLLATALKDPDEKIRENAAEALGRLKFMSEPAMPALINALSDKSSVVRCSAAEALGEIGPAAKPAIPKLVRMMKLTNRKGSDYPQICAARVLMKMTPESKTLVPAEMVKRVKERDAEIAKWSLYVSDYDRDPTRPKAKKKTKPPPRTY